MASINKKTSIKTHEGAKAKHINARLMLERSVMSCLLFEKEFYEDGQEISQRIAELVKEVDSGVAADIAIRAKEESGLRHVPLFIARELCRTKEGRAELKNVLPRVITRADDITEFMAMYWAQGKCPVAKQVKKHLGQAFFKFDEYQLAKYNGGSKAVKLKDVLKITRPKPKDKALAELLGRVIKDELKTPDTWEVSLSATKDKKAEWTRLLNEGKLGGLAMLRNIRNMINAGVDDDLISKGISNLNTNRLLPINFINAAKHNVRFESQLEEKFLDCFKKSKIEGKTTLLIDVSGSMDWALSGGRYGYKINPNELTRMDVACSLAMIAREMFKDIEIFTFSSNTVRVPARHGFALRDAIIVSQAHDSTMLGQAVKELHNPGRLIVITDEQSHDSVPDVQGAYMINVASACNGVGYGAWTHIDGWSDKVLDFIIKSEHTTGY